MKERLVLSTKIKCHKQITFLPEMTKNTGKLYEIIIVKTLKGQTIKGVTSKRQETNELSTKTSPVYHLETIFKP